MESVQENKYNRDLTLTLNHGDLNQKIEEFKTKNPEQVDELKLFLKEVLMEAEQVAQVRIDKKHVNIKFISIWWLFCLFPFSFSIFYFHFFNTNFFRATKLKRKI